MGSRAGQRLTEAPEPDSMLTGILVAHLQLLSAGFQEVTDAEDVVVCRLVDGEVTFVQRRR